MPEEVVSVLPLAEGAEGAVVVSVGVVGTAVVGVLFSVGSVVLVF